LTLAGPEWISDPDVRPESKAYPLR